MAGLQKTILESWAQDKFENTSTSFCWPKWVTRPIKEWRQRPYCLMGNATKSHCKGHRPRKWWKIAISPINRPWSMIQSLVRAEDQAIVILGVFTWFCRVTHGSSFESTTYPQVAPPAIIWACSPLSSDGLVPCVVPATWHSCPLSQCPESWLTPWVSAFRTFQVTFATFTLFSSFL